MADPTLELQGAIVAALIADPTVVGLIVDRVFDRVPEGAAFPYVTIGNAQLIADKADCIDSAETFFTLHGWSQAPGLPEIKRVSAAVVAALDDKPLALATNTLVSFLHQGTQYLDDPDGITRHAVITFHALTDPV